MRTENEVERMFAYEHLPPHLQEISQPYHQLAMLTFKTLPPCAETTLALRKLWEAKNYAVWVAATGE